MKIKQITSCIIATPWKINNEILMYLIKIPVYFYLKIFKGVILGANYKFYGLPKVFRHRGSKIEIGNRFENCE